MLKSFAVGIVIQNRWSLTKQTLTSLSFSNQDVSTYDLFLIDNGSDEKTNEELKKYLNSVLLPVKNLVCIPKVSIGDAWNLFLSLSRNYTFRIKLDNDVILHDTLAAPKKIIANQSLPSQIDPKAGAPLSGLPITGLGMIKRTNREKTKNHNRFLDHLSELQITANADITALVPVLAGSNFMTCFGRMIRQKWSGAAYVSGGCMMISKKCFDKIGYFNETLPRLIDLEYSQRAMKNAFNLSYHPYYGVLHAGANEPTEESTSVVKLKQQQAMKILEQDPIECYASSRWKKVIHKIEKACLKNRVMTLR